VRNGRDATEIFRENREKWGNSVLICMDIFCGVVPLGADMRAWRDMTGRLCAYLSSEADSVTRMFCGLEQRLK
jgi:adenosyl cobinamide kinase/adenosyl cobinamide phosphate guanylyltransferase